MLAGITGRQPDHVEALGIQCTRLRCASPRDQPP